MKRALAILILWLSFVASAFAQPVTVVGSAPTPGNCPKFFSTTQLSDSGIACGGGVSPILDAICSTNNDTLIRLTGTWQCAAYSAQFSVGSTISIASLAWGLITGTPTTLAGYGITNARTQLTGNISYYVNGNSGGTAACGPTGALTCSAGNDGNNCQSPGAACLTVQHVVNIIIRQIDLAGFTATIYLAHGSSNNYAFTCEAGPVIGQSVFGIQGDTTAKTAVTMVATSGVAVVKDLCTVSIDSVAMADNASNNAAVFIATGTGNSGHVDASNITFGALAIGTALQADYAGSISLSGANSITGSENAFIAVSNGGNVDAGSQTTTLVGTPAFATAFAYLVNGGSIVVNGSSFSGAATGPKCLIVGSLEVSGFDPNVVFPGSTNCTANNLVQSVNVTSGVLANGTSAFNLTATQPASPVAAQNAVTWNITSAGSAAQNNNGLLFTYAAGYTGANRTAALNAVNQVAGTASTLIPSAAANLPSGNGGGFYNSTGTTAGLNFGTQGGAGNGNINVGIVGTAQISKNSATNIGGAFSAINGGSSPVQIGLWASLNQTTPPAVSAAAIFDNASQANPIALFQAGGATQFQVDQNGQIITSFGTPTIASGACGATTNGTLAAGATNQAGQVQIGAAATTTCTVSFSKTLTAAPLACVLFPANAAAAATGTTVARVSSIGTTNWVITGAALANANYYYHCI